MDLRILVLDDNRASLLKSLQDALAPFLDNPAALDDALSRGEIVELHRLVDRPVRLQIASNESQDPSGVLQELEALRDTAFDLVLLDDHWDPHGMSADLSFAGQDQLLKPVFHYLHGPDKGPPMIVLFTRHWDDQAERVDRYGELLLRPPYRGSLRVTGFDKSDSGSLRLLIQQLVTLREAIDARHRADAQVGFLSAMLRSLGYSSTDQLPVTSPPSGLRGNSPSMQALLALAQRWAATDFQFHIFGEVGVGKSALASYIHSLSSRAKQPFLKLVLQQSDEIMESELFGHEAGAFTGAKARKEGIVELAHRGTLFLDDIDKMPPRLQHRFVHFIDERKFLRVGGTRSVEVDVRIISASNRSLDELVSGGQFLRDLYDRLRIGNTLHVPPLRDRREDIPAIADFLIAKLGNPFTLTPRATQLLKEHEWRRGNVRELEAFIEKVATLARGEEISDDRLFTLLESSPLESSQAAPLTATSPATLSTTPQPYDPLNHVKARLEVVQSMLARGCGPGEIGKALYSKVSDKHPHVMISTFFQGKEVAELFSTLGEATIQMKFPHVLAYLQGRKRSAFQRRGASYPSWVRMKE